MQVVTNWSVTVNEWASLAQPGNCLVVDLWVQIPSAWDSTEPPQPALMTIIAYVHEDYWTARIGKSADWGYTGIAISGIKPEERIARSYFGNIPAELPYRADAPTGIEV